MSDTRVCSFFLSGNCTKGKECRYSHDSTKKPETSSAPVCKFYLEGNCKQGNRCKFSHEKEKYLDKKSKTPCKEFLKGTCNRGATCLFSHDLSRPTCILGKLPSPSLAVLRKKSQFGIVHATVCEDFAQLGVCIREECAFYHPEIRAAGLFFYSEEGEKKSFFAVTEEKEEGLVFSDPGGKIETLDKTPFDCAIREFLEETMLSFFSLGEGTPEGLFKANVNELKKIIFETLKEQPAPIYIEDAKYFMYPIPGNFPKFREILDRRVAKDKRFKGDFCEITESNNQFHKRIWNLLDVIRGDTIFTDLFMRY